MFLMYQGYTRRLVMKKRFGQPRKGMVDHVCGPCKAGGISGTAFPLLRYQMLLQYLLLVRAGHQGQTRLAHITLLPFAQQSLLSGASYFSFFCCAFVSSFASCFALRTLYLSAFSKALMACSPILYPILCKTFAIKMWPSLKRPVAKAAANG